MADECSPETAVPFSDEFVAWRHRFVQFLSHYIRSPDHIHKAEVQRTWSLVLKFIIETSLPRWQILLEFKEIHDKDISRWIGGDIPSLRLRRTLVKLLMERAVKKLEAAEMLKNSSANDNGL